MPVVSPAWLEAAAARTALAEPLPDVDEDRYAPLAAQATNNGFDMPEGVQCVRTSA